MKLLIEKVKSKNFDTVQLINKVNQFNLTSMRFERDEFQENLKENKTTLTLIANLKDIYGDHGYTALALLSQKIKFYILKISYYPAEF